MKNAATHCASRISVSSDDTPSPDAPRNRARGTGPPGSVDSRAPASCHTRHAARVDVAVFLKSNRL